LELYKKFSCDEQRRNRRMLRVIICLKEKEEENRKYTSRGLFPLTLYLGRSSRIPNKLVIKTKTMMGLEE